MTPHQTYKEPVGGGAVAAYHAIALEYYDVDRHPTCANFRDASVRALRPWLRRCCTSDARLVEVGAGQSVLLQYLNGERRRLSRVLVTDASPIMLNYSRPAGAEPYQLAVAEADHLPAADGEFTALVASLGDPYNESGFWREAYRVLCPNGRVLFTTPSHEWARAFRKPDDEKVAVFDLADGRQVRAPSLILEVDDQLDLMRSHGFRTLAVQEIALADIDGGRISQKLTLPGLESVPIVRGYLARKPG